MEEERERKRMAFFKCAPYPPPCQILPSLLLSSHPPPHALSPPFHIALRAEVSLNLLLVAMVKSLTLSLFLLALSERTQIVFGSMRGQTATPGPT